MKSSGLWAAVSSTSQTRSSLDPDSTLEVRSSSSSTEAVSPDENVIKRVTRICRHLLNSQKQKEALPLIEEALQKHPRRPELLVLQGECLQRAGHTTKAVTCYAQAHAHDASNADALMHLAAVHHTQGELSHCLEMVQQACELQPENREFKEAVAGVMSDLGTELKNQGKLEESIQRYQEALGVQSEFVPALYNLGVAYSESSQFDKALEYYRLAVEMDPSHAMAWGNIAALYLTRQQFQESLECHQKALAANPTIDHLHKSYAQLLVIVGARSKEAGDAKKAIECYEEALSHHPACVEAMYNLGIVYSEAGKKWKAIFLYETAIHYNARLPALYNNLGVLYKDLGQEDKAMNCYQNALSIKPDFAMSLSNIGLLYAMKGCAGEALEKLTAAVKADPKYFEAYNNLGVVQKDVGLTNESLESYKKSLGIAPECRSPADNFLLGLNYVMCGSSPVVGEHHVEWGAALSQRIPQMPPTLPTVQKLDTNKILKIGYISADLCTHSVAYFAEAPFSEHDPENVQPVVYNCSPRPDDKTKVLQSKVMAAQGIWRDVGHLTEKGLAEQVREDDIDILVELSGHTSNNRLGTMAMKPAPIQVTWIGYPNSTGLKQVDYRLTDVHCDPEETTQIFSEELVRLQHCFLCYTPFSDPPPCAPAPCLENGYITFGSFNNLAKITDEVIQVWSEILLAIPDARLVLKHKTFACEATRARVTQRFERQGIDSWRLDLLPISIQTKYHLSQYSFMDISLDPWPYAGTTTTCESLFMGVPCLTLAGHCHAQNVGASLLRTVGLDESWIAKYIQEYKDQAIAKASDFASLDKLRSNLRVQMLSSELCNARGHVQRLEAEYRKMWAKWSSLQHE